MPQPCIGSSVRVLRMRSSRVPRRTSFCWAGISDSYVGSLQEVSALPVESQQEQRRYFRSILPSRWVPESASQIRLRVESTEIFRTIAVAVGIAMVAAVSVAGSNTTTSFLPDSSYQILPSGPTAIPYG